MHWGFRRLDNFPFLFSQRITVTSRLIKWKGAGHHQKLVIRTFRSNGRYREDEISYSCDGSKVTLFSDLWFQFPLDTVMLYYLTGYEIVESLQ